MPKDKFELFRQRSDENKPFKNGSLTRRGFLKVQDEMKKQQNIENLKEQIDTPKQNDVDSNINKENESTPTKEN